MHHIKYQPSYLSFAYCNFNSITLTNVDYSEDVECGFDVADLQES